MIRGMSTAFTQRFPVRFDECAADGTARASALLRYVVETAFAHSAHEGFPLAWYDTHGLYWLVRYARLDLSHAVPYGVLLDVTTEVVGFRRIWARRRNAIRNPEGGLLGQITMDWIFTDREGNPARVAPEMQAAFPGLTEPLEVRRLDVADPPTGIQPNEYRVPAHQVDPRGHMNNAAYLELFEDVLVNLGADPQARPATYELEYLMAASLGEPLHSFVWAVPGGWVMIASTLAGMPVAKSLRRSRSGELDERPD